MAGQQQGGGGGSGDGANDFLWGSAAIIAITIIIWYFFRNQIIVAVLYIKLAEIKAMSLYSNQYDQMANWINYYINKPHLLTVDDLSMLLRITNVYLKYVAAAILFLISAYVYFFSGDKKLTSVHSMKSLAEQEVSIWPQITPVVNLDLLNMPLDKGPWAMVTPPQAFAKKYGIIIPPQRDQQTGEATLTATINEDIARKVFINQMGQKFTTIDAQPKHVKALIAIFAAKSLEMRKESKELIDFIASSSGNGVKNLDFSKVEGVLRKVKKNVHVLRVCSKHNYVYTVMASMLEFARADGVLASADFLWLKPYDRMLWYVLNTVGRQTAPCEIAGPFAHWLAEKELQRKLLKPMINEAVIALKQEIEGSIYLENNEEESIL